MNYKKKGKNLSGVDFYRKKMLRKPKQELMNAVGSSPGPAVLKADINTIIPGVLGAVLKQVCLAKVEE